MTDPATLASFYIVTVSIAGFLLPVIQAVMLFITERSFNKYEFSRQELVNLYRKQGAVLSVCLAYLIIQPILLMLSLWEPAKITAVIFVITAVVYRIRQLHDTGMWETTFSTKFIPQNSSAIYKYYRACRNNAAPQLINALLFLLAITAPVFMEPTLAFSVLFILIYTTLSITVLLNNPMSIQAEILKTENTGYELSSDESKWNEEKTNIEEQVIKQHLSTRPFYTDKELITDTSGLFTYSTNWFVKKDNGEFWCNVWVEKIKAANLDELKIRINEIVKTELVYLAKAKTDVNSFALSFHIQIDGKSRNAFFRANKQEIDSLKQKKPADFVKSLKNKFYDEVLA